MDRYDAYRVDDLLTRAVRCFIALIASGRATDWPGRIRTHWRSRTYTAYWVAGTRYAALRHRRRKSAFAATLRSRRDNRAALRKPLKSLAAVRVRYDYRCLHLLVAREG